MNNTLRGVYASISTSWDMLQVPADITMRQVPPVVNIDYRAARASIGYEEPLAFQVSFSHQALEAAQKGIERRTWEGLFLENSRAGKAVFAELVQQEDKKDVGTVVLAFVESVRIIARPQPVQFRVETGGVRLKVDVQI